MAAVWWVQVPSKIRVFLWRLARHSIPVRGLLHRRNMADNNASCMCGVQDTWKHSLLDCHMAKCVWALEREEITEFLWNIQELNARDWLAVACSTLSQEEMTRVAVTLWATWHARRKVIHERSFQSPLLTHLFVERFVSDLELIRSIPMEKGTKQPSLWWIPPPVRCSKINVDAAISKNLGVASVAAMARDAGDVFLGASAIVLDRWLIQRR